MEDFRALAARVAARVGELRGCLIVSRDGLLLGSYPDGDEALVKSAWLRFAALGDPEKGFVEFGLETWCYVRRGPYAAFALTGVGARPGLVLDELEACLLRAEELRARSGPVEVPEVPAVPVSKPRVSPGPKAQPVPAAHEPTSRPSAETSPDEEPSAETSPDEEIDRVLLAREFAGLLQERQDRDEA